MNKKIIIITMILFALSIAVILAITSLELFAPLAKQESANIGTTLSGAITPIFTFISVILLFLTLYRQEESNRDQKAKNDADIIFLLIDSFQKDLDRFGLTVTTGPTNNRVDTRQSGFEALYSFLKFLDAKHLISSASEFFGLLNSLDLIKKRINLSNFEPTTKKLFEEKIKILYTAYIRGPINSLIKNLDKEPDKSTLEIRRVYDFYNTWESLINYP